MRTHRRWPVLLALGLVAQAALTTPVGAGGVFQGAVVSPSPVRESPRILNGTVLALAEAGNKIIVGGTFTSARDYRSGSPTLTRNRILAFHKATGLIDTAFVPSFDETVNALVASPDGQWVYVGGAFNNLNGAEQRKLVKLSVADGRVDTAFTGRADAAVEDMALAGGLLIVGGRFTRLGGVPRERLGAVDPASGLTSAALNLPIGGSRDSGSPHILELDTSPDGRRLVVAGNFTLVGSAFREQVGLIDLSTSPATVADWATDRFHPDCSTSFPGTYVNDVAFSPDGTYFVTATTGAFRAHQLCDSAHRWDVAPGGTRVDPTWVVYTGGDTFWHIMITDSAVYLGGHQRWMNNPNPSPRGNDDGPGSVSRQGIGAVDPRTGVPLRWNPTRQRGKGVESFLATSTHLYVGSDTRQFAGTTRDRLAVLPVAGGSPNPQPETVTLPVNLYTARADGSLYVSRFDGATVSAPAVVSGPAGNDWATHRDAWVQRGQWYNFGAADAYYRRSFDGAAFGPVTNLSATVGYVDDDASLTPYDQPYNVNTTKTAAYRDGRIFYTKTNDTRLFWRWFSLESGIVGAQEYLASSADWSGATGLEVAGNWLYATWSDNRLYRAFVSGARVEGSRVLVNDGAVPGGIPWSQVRALAFTHVDGAFTEPVPPAPPAPLACPAGQWKAEYYQGTQLLGAADTVRCEATLNVNWGSGTPAGTRLSPTGYSVRWTADLNLGVAGSYLFTILADDGFMLVVDGIPVLDSWTEKSSASTLSTRVTLGAGSHQVRLDFFKNTGSGAARLTYGL
jgi:hypothetical protein